MSWPRRASCAAAEVNHGQLLGPRWTGLRCVGDLKIPHRPRANVANMLAAPRQGAPTFVPPPRACKEAEYKDSNQRRQARGVDISLGARLAAQLCGEHG